MKIGIITQPLINNYGGFLQNYALQKILKDNGHDVVTLDWTPHRAPFYLKTFSIIKTICLIILGQKRRFHYQLSKIEEDIINQNFIKFADKHLCRTLKSHNSKELRQRMLDEECNALIVGSDQCWRPSYCYGFEMAMFCDFAENDDILKLTYAVSLGTDRWEYNAKQTNIARRLLDSFTFISIREKSGIKICEKELGITPIHVLDPTLLLRRDDYLKLLDPHTPRQYNGLFYYILDPTDDKLTFVQSLAKSKNMNIFTIMPKFQSEVRTRWHVKSYINDCIFPPIENWIRAFEDAEFVVVDSFHGCVFSIIFNKPFWVIGNEHRGMSRFISLLSMFNLESRLITETQLNCMDINASIDWDHVNLILDHQKQLCLNLLLSQLK